MRASRGLLVLVLPVLAGALLAAAVLARRSDSTQALPIPGSHAASAISPAPALLASVPVRSQKPASEDVIARSAEDAYVRSTYQNIRIAVASGNEVVQKALLDALGPNRGAALRLAEQDLSGPRSQTDRDVTIQTLDLLRNPR